MKLLKLTFSFLFISVAINGYLLADNHKKNALIQTQKNYIKKVPRIELPEEAILIDSTDNLRGYFDKDSILHIEFNNNNKISFQWEGLEKDIPKDGNSMLHLSTNENTVYLNPVDE